MEAKVDIIRESFLKILEKKKHDNFFSDLIRLGKKHGLKNIKGTEIAIQLFERSGFLIIHFLFKPKIDGYGYLSEVSDILIPSLSDTTFEKIKSIQKQLRKKGKASFAIKMPDPICKSVSDKISAYTIASTFFKKKEAGLVFSSINDFFEIDSFEKTVSYSGDEEKRTTYFFRWKMDDYLHLRNMDVSLDSEKDIDDIIAPIFEELGFDINHFKKNIQEEKERFIKLLPSIVYGSDKFSGRTFTVFTRKEYIEFPRMFSDFISERSSIIPIVDNDNELKEWIDLKFLEESIHDKTLIMRGPKKQSTWTVKVLGDTTNVTVELGEADVYELLFDTKQKSQQLPPVSIFINEFNTKKITDRIDIAPAFALKFSVGG